MFAELGTKANEATATMLTTMPASDADGDDADGTAPLLPAENEIGKTFAPVIAWAVSGMDRARSIGLDGDFVPESDIVSPIAVH